MTRDDLLERARAHIIATTAVPDVASVLAQSHLAYGLAKIHLAQEAAGFSADATFVATPDMTTPRQVAKWRFGLAMGGLLAWGRGDRPLVLLDLQIGTSTVLVGGLDELPDTREVAERAARLQAHPPIVMGLRCGWDYAGGNHFINVYRVRPRSGASLPPYAIVLHGGGSEIKRPSPLGPGLDYEASEPLREVMTTVETSLGDVRMLVGRPALDYHAAYERALAFSRAKQIEIASELFGPHQPISHTTHHGLAGLNAAVLGCSRFEPGSSTLYPLTLRPDLPAFLLSGRPNLRCELLPATGLSAAARQAALAANVLPHGGGYTYPGVAALDGVLEAGGMRYSVLALADGGRRVVGCVGTLPYAHRGMEVMERVRQWEMADVAATMDLVFSLTT